MRYFRRLEGYTPPERDVTHWTQYRIEEAVTPSDVDATTIKGPTTLVPAITDPTDPPTYNVETSNAALATGWYRLVWIDANGDTQPTPWVPLRNLSPYAPTVGDVSTILYSRLVEAGGERVTSFTDQTRPTAQEVQQLIIMHAPLIFARLGRLDNLHCSNAEDLRAAATAIAAQRVALEVEAAFWPEEFGEFANPADRRAALDADVTGLVPMLEACRASVDEGGDGGESHSRTDVAWLFPPPARLRY